jgi:hypothetical protein
VDRGTLVAQMARAIAGDRPRVDLPDEELKRRAGEALSRVEVYLGVEIEEAKEIVTKVIEDVP